MVYETTLNKKIGDFPKLHLSLLLDALLLLLPSVRVRLVVIPAMVEAASRAVVVVGLRVGVPIGLAEWKEQGMLTQKSSINDCHNGPEAGALKGKFVHHQSFTHAVLRIWLGLQCCDLEEFIRLRRSLHLS